MGFEESLACLEAGANDFSGTLMEEHISKSAGANFGEYVSPEAIPRADPPDWPHSGRAHNYLRAAACLQRDDDESHVSRSHRAEALGRN